jgi:ubiquitin carboxyl-terminal hydrolase 10
MKEFGTSEQITSLASTNAEPSETGTIEHSDAGSTHATASSSVKAATRSSRLSVSPATSRPIVRPAIPVVLPPKQPLPITKVDSSVPASGPPDSHQEAVQNADNQASAEPLDASAKSAEVPATKPTPKSWADLVRSNTPQGPNAASSNGLLVPTTNPASATSKSNALADVIRDFNVNNGGKLSFLEPRGLVNTGNMCYMNSVGVALWVLVFR